MKISLISLYTVLALVLSATGCICMDEGCPEDTPPTTPTKTQAAAPPPADTRWVDVRAYEDSIMFQDGGPALVSGTTVYLIPHYKGVIDVRHGPAFCPQSLVDFIEKQVAEAGLLQNRLATMKYQSDIRQALEEAYAAFIGPLVQRHTEVVNQLAALGVIAGQEDRIFAVANTVVGQSIREIPLALAFAGGQFPDPRVHLESSNALLRQARLVELQIPCTMLTAINAR